MSAEEELAKALAEVEAARRELDAARAELADAESGKSTKAAAKKPAAKPKRATRGERPVHRSDLRSECSGTGERFTGADKVRIDMTPVVTKFANPMQRPNEYKPNSIECLLVFDVKQGFMDSDSWKRCKCLDCVKLRKIGQ
jgi:hypothetical protein